MKAVDSIADIGDDSVKVLLMKAAKMEKYRAVLEHIHKALKDSIGGHK